MENKNLKKEISLFMATMLVCGNMIGSGVFMLPATLADVSGPIPTIIAWIITTLGSVLIAISFANPYHLRDLPAVKTYINAYTTSEHTVKAVVDKLLGRSEFTGKNPVDTTCGYFELML